MKSVDVHRCPSLQVSSMVYTLADSGRRHRNPPAGHHSGTARTRGAEPHQVGATLRDADRAMTTGQLAAAVAPPGRVNGWLRKVMA